ncbi:MAG TPA: hypothetical protein DIT07_00205 [Sphingobacteriaceae bacterium]|nr:hypothetical protein [Sphingobacteriaceae bacterium]
MFVSVTRAFAPVIGTLFLRSISVRGIEPGKGLCGIDASESLSRARPLRGDSVGNKGYRCSKGTPLGLSPSEWLHPGGRNANSEIFLILFAYTTFVVYIYPTFVVDQHL